MIGSMIFGVYNLYITKNMIDEDNRNIQLRIDEDNRNIRLRIDENNRKKQILFDELFKRIEKLEK